MAPSALKPVRASRAERVRPCGPCKHVMAYEIHDPAGRDHAYEKENKAVHAVADHGFRCGALRDTEDDRREAGKQYHGREMRRRERHGFLPAAMLCASTAAIKFNRPATTMNFAP